MDAKLQWKISPKVETLVDVIVACKGQLRDITQKRHPRARNLSLVYCDVHASPKLVELLGLSDLWKAHAETAAQCDERQSKRPVSQEMVADFGTFYVVRDAVVGDGAIRVVAAFDTGNNCEIMFGNVELVP